MSGNTQLPLGLRNNNPLNIRVSGEKWLGKIPTDNGFEKFSSLEYGIRAAVINLRTYFNKYNCRTVSSIISRWAPANENNTNAYIQYVANKMGVNSVSVLSLNSGVMSKLVAAMSDVELSSKYGVSPEKVNSVISSFKLL